MKDSKKYIMARGSFYQDVIDNWLLMVPSSELSSDAKIVFFVLKKMQDSNASSQTDSHSWYKISGLDRASVDKALFELERFGLIEFYRASYNNNGIVGVCTNYLLYHPLMGDDYRIIPCPHQNKGMEDPINGKTKISSKALLATESIRKQYGLPTIKEELTKGELSN